MKNKLFLRIPFYISILVLSIFFSCKKETVPQPVLPDNSCVKVEKDFPKTKDSVWVFYPGFQKYGSGKAIKINRVTEFDAVCNIFEGKPILTFRTYYIEKNENERAENLDFDLISNKIGCYKLKNDVAGSNEVRATFLSQDSDVVLSGYAVDESASNYLEITKLDTIANEVEGKFMVTFLRNKNKQKLDFLYDTLRFSNGSFKCKIIK